MALKDGMCTSYCLLPINVGNFVSYILLLYLFCVCTYLFTLNIGNPTLAPHYFPTEQTEKNYEIDLSAASSFQL